MNGTAHPATAAKIANVLLEQTDKSEATVSDNLPDEFDAADTMVLALAMAHDVRAGEEGYQTVVEPLDREDLERYK
jgi:hypothetical protein